VLDYLSIGTTLPLLDVTCLFFHIVPIVIQAFVQTLHKLDDPLITEVSHQSITIRNCLHSSVSILGTHLAQMFLYQS
jgi:hypothetical protein